MLKKVGATIAGVFRTSDSAYRYGGEEFLIMLPEQSLEAATVAATVAAERLRRTVEGLAIPHESRGPDAVVTVSAGLARLSLTEQDVAALLRRADEALYEAKAGGKNRVASHTSGGL